MKIRTLLPAALIGFALLLTGCEISVVGGTPLPQPDVTYSAQSLGAGESPTARSIEVPGGDSIIVEVTLGSAAQADEAIYFEVDGGGDAEILQYSAGGATLASSASPDVFLRGTAALSSAGAATAVEPQIVTVQSCLGPCIIDDADGSTFFLEVFNNAAFTQNFDLYLYTQAYADEYDPGNDSASTAVGLGGGASNTDEGAIETIGDQDYWAIQASGDLFFDAMTPLPPGLDLRLRLVASNGVVVGTFQPGTGAITVLDGDTAIVFENGNDGAAVSGSSVYFLEIQ